VSSQTSIFTSPLHPSTVHTCSRAHPNPSPSIPLTPQAKDAHASAVRSYAVPAAPVAPALPADLAAELSKFDATEPTLGNAAAAAPTPAASEEGAQSAAEFLKFLEADIPKDDGHH
jgi:F-type H+-transporting ATPase subunit h